MFTRVTEEAMAPFHHIIQQIKKHSKARDIRGMLKYFVPDEELVSFGVEANINRKSDLEQHWENFFRAHEPVHSEYKDIVVYQASNAACMTLLNTYPDLNGPDMRITLYLENHQGEWLIRHRHHSWSPEP